MTTQSKTLIRLTLLMFCTHLAIGCSGTVGANNNAPRDDSTPQGSDVPGGMGGMQAEATVPGVGPAGLRRLTRRELDNTLGELLGDQTHVALTFLPDPSNLTLGYETFKPLGGAELQQYRDAAEKLAATAVKDLTSFAPCASGTQEATCAKSMIERFGRRAFRRPLDDGETADLVALYNTVRTQTRGSYADGIRLVVTAMLQDPRFLYQRQLGTGKRNDNGLVALDGYDIASRLSYSLWKTMPDAKLFAAAEAGRLVQDGDIGAEVNRMLNDPRARELTSGWVDSLMGLERLSGLSRPADKYPQWSPALADAMRADTEDFVTDIVLKGDAKVESLFSSTAAFVTPALASVYGASGDGRIELDGKQRGGLLTKAAFLTLSQSPVLRGKFVREQLFCQHVPPPPPDAQGKGKVAPAGASERERASIHSQDPACAACHSLMDPIGFTLLAYDAIGRFDASADVDARGSLTSTDVDGDVNGPAQLSTRLVKSGEVGQCISSRWFRTLLAREETDADAATMVAAAGALQAGRNPLRDMVKALTASPAFRYRSPLPGEPLQ